MAFRFRLGTCSCLDGICILNKTSNCNWCATPHKGLAATQHVTLHKNRYSQEHSSRTRQSESQLQEVHRTKVSSIRFDATHEFTQEKWQTHVLYRYTQSPITACCVPELQTYISIIEHFGRHIQWHHFLESPGFSFPPKLMVTKNLKSTQNFFGEISSRGH